MYEIAGLDLDPDSTAYLESLNLDGVERERLSMVLGLLRGLAGVQLSDIFVSNVADQEGGAILSSVWAFAGPHWLEARDFLRKLDFDISPYEHSVTYIGVQCEEIADLAGTMSDKSRMFIEVRTDRVEYSSASAVGLNCERLSEVVQKLLVPNLRVGHHGPTPATVEASITALGAPDG
jgi:hypothetical protein